MPGQAVKLVDRMKADSKIDMENDWKVITLFVGGNDLCDYCDDKVYFRFHLENSYIVSLSVYSKTYNWHVFHYENLPNFFSF